MEKMEQLYEGKAKKVYATSDPNLVIVSYKDDATALDGKKRGTIVGKGVINNKMSNFMMQKLEKVGVPTHYVEQLNDRETVVKKVSIVPLEVIIRNIAAGSFSKRYGVEEGTDLAIPTIEFSYKNDDLHDPLINDYHAIALACNSRRDRADQSIRIQSQRHDERIPAGSGHHSGRLQAGIRQEPLMVPSYWLTRSALTPAVSGMSRPVHIWTKTCSVVTSAAQRKLIRKSCAD